MYIGLGNLPVVLWRPDGPNYIILNKKQIRKMCSSSYLYNKSSIILEIQTSESYKVFCCCFYFIFFFIFFLFIYFFSVRPYWNIKHLH